eukprot:318352_1
MSEERDLERASQVVDDESVKEPTSCCQSCCNISWSLCQLIGIILALIWITFLLFLITQSIDDIHLFITNNIDETATHPEPEAETDCAFEWENISSRFDIFLVIHFLQYYITSFIIRNRKLLWSASLLWEIIEFAMSHIPALKLGAAKECWWDSVIFDILLMNALGILLRWYVLIPSLVLVWVWVVVLVWIVWLALLVIILVWIVVLILVWAVCVVIVSATVHILIKASTIHIVISPSLCSSKLIVSILLLWIVLIVVLVLPSLIHIIISALVPILSHCDGNVVFV